MNLSDAEFSVLDKVPASTQKTGIGHKALIGKFTGSQETIEAAIKDLVAKELILKEDRGATNHREAGRFYLRTEVGDDMLYQQRRARRKGGN